MTNKNITTGVIAMATFAASVQAQAQYTSYPVTGTQTNQRNSATLTTYEEVNIRIPRFKKFVEDDCAGIDSVVSASVLAIHASL